MSVNINQVKELLRKNNYLTIVRKADDGCIITYPHAKLTTKSPQLVQSFSFQRGEHPGILISTSLEKEKEKFIALPEYVMRLYILTETVLQHALINLDSQMIIYLDDNNTEFESLAEIIQSCSTQEEDEKENLLINTIIEARNIGFPAKYKEIAETKGIGIGYNIIRKFYE